MTTKSLSPVAVPVVSALPTPVLGLAGVTLRLESDNKPYWCTGAAWVDMSGSGAGNVFIQDTDPLAASPYIWFKTDLATGKVLDILKG